MAVGLLGASIAYLMCNAQTARSLFQHISLPMLRAWLSASKKTFIRNVTLQVLKREPDAKLLLCAPQNYSADLLASALSSKVSVAEMIRLNDPRRPPNQARHLTSAFPRFPVTPFHGTAPLLALTICERACAYL